MYWGYPTSIAFPIALMDYITPDHWVLLPSRQPPTSPFRTVWETMGEDLLYIQDDKIPAHKMMNYIT